MTGDQESAFVQEQLKQARARGLKQPVLLGLASQSRHARAVHEALCGEPMPPPSEEGGTDADQAFVVCGATVAQLLRTFAGDGGDFLARMLADHPGIDIWSIALRADGINYSAFLDGLKLMTGHAPYENGGRPMQTPREMMTGAGPTLLHLGSDSGEITLVCGRSGPVAALAGALVAAVASPRMTVPHLDRTIEVEVTDDLVASMLYRAFTGQAAAVAEAVMALRKRSGNHADRLLRILESRPELRDLAQQVHQELTGE